MSLPSVATDVARLQELSREQENIDRQLSLLYEQWETLAED